MTRDYQQQARLRKIIYLGLILALAFGTYILRESTAYGIRSQAERLGIREQNLGEVELTGSAVRLSLTGLRGYVTCGLWMQAIDKQKRHEWNELELLVRSLTKLQPHFITPWLFQSWNLAYNVSVESDRIRDKYFYMAQGIELLSQGERQNQRNPDVRFMVGFYNQHKIGLSDEAATLRCLYQMSCIDPQDRDPDWLRPLNEQGRREVDKARFEEFCKKNPMLVRRFREMLFRQSPDDVIDFLEENRKLPSLYQEQAIKQVGSLRLPTPKKEDVTRRFPILPPLQKNPADPTTPDFDNYAAARDWYIYANEPLPPPTKELSGSPPPFDRTLYRMPKAMSQMIFRQYPARGQTYIGENLEKEGWFDSDGWRITGEWFPDDKFQDGKPAIVGTSNDWWAIQAWEKAFNMWREHGVENGLYLEPEEYRSLEDEAAKFRSYYGILPSDPPGPVAADRWRPDMEAGLRAHARIYWLAHYRNMTNFPHFYFTTQVEQKKETVELRKMFFEAKQLREAKGEPEQAFEIYRTALPRWYKLLLDHREFRADDFVQETTYETEMYYQGLIERMFNKPLHELNTVVDYLGQRAYGVHWPLSWLPSAAFLASPQAGGMQPMDILTPEGQVLINEDVKTRIRERMQLPPLRPAVATAPPPSSPMPTSGARRPDAMPTGPSGDAAKQLK